MEVEEEPSVSFASSSIVVAMVYLKVLMELSFQRHSQNGARQQDLQPRIISFEASIIKFTQASCFLKMCNEVERSESVFTQLQCSSNAEKSETYLCSVSM